MNWLRMKLDMLRDWFYGFDRRKRIAKMNHWEAVERAEFVDASASKDRN